MVKDRMQDKCTKGNPGTAFEAFTLASLELPYNETVRRLSANFNAQVAIANTLTDIGLTRFINLTHRSDDALISLALYAGDGIVVKVIPVDYMGAPGAIYHTPAISAHEVKIENRDFYGEYRYDNFFVKPFPWIPPGIVEDEDIAGFRNLLARVNIKMTEGDDRAKNIHTLPTKSRRLIGIDSAMFDVSESTITKEQEDGWHKFMHLLYPIYTEGKVPPQTANTNFEFVSIHDPVMEGAEFNDQTGDVILPPVKPFERKAHETFAQALMRHLGIKKRALTEEKPTVDL